MITVKIDVTKIDKALLFKGEKGTYLDIVLWETPDDKFGNDYRVTQSVSKEAREKGVKGNILGNGKIRSKGAASSKAPDSSTPPAAPKPAENLDEDVPF